MFPDVSEIELCGPSGRQSGDCTHEVASFSHRVDYNHDGILPIRFWQLCYKINTGSVPRCVRDWERVKFSGGWQMNGFGSEAHVTSGDIPAYVPRHLRPPIVSRN